MRDCIAVLGICAAFAAAVALGNAWLALSDAWGAWVVFAPLGLGAAAGYSAILRL